MRYRSGCMITIRHHVRATHMPHRMIVLDSYAALVLRWLIYRQQLGCGLRCRSTNGMVGCAAWLAGMAGMGVVHRVGGGLKEMRRRGLSGGGSRWMASSCCVQVWMGTKERTTFCVRSWLICGFDHIYLQPIGCRGCKVAYLQL